jgi:gliding motility-associated lipoprotein GldD
MLKPLLTILTCATLLTTACENRQDLPKPRAYPKIVYPKRGYLTYTNPECPFSFGYPQYADIVRDSTHFNDPLYNDCWFDIFVPDFDCRLYCSYYQIGKEKTLEELKADAFEMADWHNKKANYIEEQRIQRGDDLQGIAFRIEGPAATPFEFYLTDNKTHFFRGALYFNTQINTDSLAPLYNFVLEDIARLIETFEWRN